LPVSFGHSAWRSTFVKARFGAAQPTVPLYLIAIAWVYVTLLMALTERSFVAGFATFVFYGLLPLLILLWLLDTPARRRRRRARESLPDTPSVPSPPPAPSSPTRSTGKPDD
jgi:hypothetical protein